VHVYIELACLEHHKVQCSQLNVLHACPRIALPSFGCNYREGVRDVVRLFGWRGLFKGFWPVMLRAFPSSAAALGGIHLVEVAFADMERRKVLLADDVPRLARKHTSGGGKLGIDTAPDNKQSLATVIAQVDTGDRTS